MGVSSRLEPTKVNITQKGYCDMARFPSCEEIRLQIRAAKKQDVMRIVEALIAAGGYELEPEQIVDAAFKLVSLIDRRLIEDNVR